MRGFLHILSNTFIAANLRICNEKKCFGFEFFVGDVISEVSFWPFWLMVPGLRPNHYIRGSQTGYMYP